MYIYIYAVGRWEMFPPPDVALLQVLQKFKKLQGLVELLQIGMLKHRKLNIGGGGEESPPRDAAPRP